jgi:hypothetical protein
LEEQTELSLLPASAGFLLGLLFDPEHGGDVPPKHWAISKPRSVTTHTTMLFDIFIY